MQEQMLGRRAVKGRIYMLSVKIRHISMHRNTRQVVYHKPNTRLKVLQLQYNIMKNKLERKITASRRL